MVEESHYFKNILGEDSKSFLNIFKKTWNEHISTFPQKYSEGEQFVIGARFRPVLMCWGYVLSEANFDISAKKELSKLALHVELLHKSTLLIDDLIDNDSTRHGKKSFHIQFSDNEAILFAIYLVGDSFEQLSKSLKRSKLNGSHFDLALLYSKTIKEMTRGALREVNIENDELTSFNTIKEIIEDQTISIIKNGLLGGFIFGEGNSNLIDVVDLIGYDCGYIFQLLNDLEPFGCESINSKHKGRNNIDVLHSRKNLVIPFIYNSLIKKKQLEFQQILVKNTCEDERLKEVIYYYQEYKVIDLILENLKNVRANIDNNINELGKKTHNTVLVSDFAKFLNFILHEAVKRVGTSHYKMLSEILIK